MTMGGLAGRSWAGTRRYRPILVLDVVMIVVFSIWQQVFFTRSNLENVLTSVSIIWIVAMGMTFVLISAGFDLSAGALATVCGIVLARLLGQGLPGGVAIVLAVLAGGVVGALLNGLLVGRLGLSVFVVTLGTMTALTGVASLLTNTQTLPVASGALDSLVAGRLAGLPVIVWVMLATFLIALYVQTRTHFGRDVYAVGGSMTAARLSGIHTGRVLTVVYLAVGLCAGLGGVVAAGRIGGAAPQVDGTLPLQAIAAVLLGGTSLTGGLGGVGGTVFGVLFIGILQNGLSLSGVQTFWQQVITGVILVAAVLGDRISLRGWRGVRPRASRTGTGPPAAVEGAGPAPVSSGERPASTDQSSASSSASTTRSPA